MTDDNSLHAIKPNSGDLIWTYRAKTPLSTTLFIAHDFTIYLYSKNNKLIALTPGGTERWIRSFKDKLLHMPVASPDGSIIISFSSGRLVKVNGRGAILWDISVDVDEISPVIDSQGNLYRVHKNGALQSLNKSGIENWKYTFDNPLIYLILWDNSIMVLTKGQKLISINVVGEENWTLNSLPLSTPLSMLNSSSSMEIIYKSGVLLSIDRNGEIIGNVQGPPNSGFASKDEQGNIYIYGNNKDLHVYDGKEFHEIISETALSPPLIGSNGNLVSGGENWLVYSYITPGAALGWSGYRGGPQRNGSLDIALNFKEMRNQYINDSAYKYYKLMSESEELEIRLEVLKNFEKLYMENNLLNKFPFVILILMDMAREGIRNRGNLLASPLVRIKALNLLGKINDLRTRTFLVNHLYKEENASVAISNIWALGRIGFDYDGEITRAVASVKERFYRDDGVLLTICDTFEELIYYNGIIPDQSGLHILSSIYSSDAPPLIRRRAIEIFEKFTGRGSYK